MCSVKSQYKGSGRRPPPFVELLGVTLCRLGERWGPSWGCGGHFWVALGCLWTELDPASVGAQFGLPWGALMLKHNACAQNMASWNSSPESAESADPRNPRKWCQEVLSRPLLPRAPVGQDDGSLSKLPQTTCKEGRGIHEHPRFLKQASA